MVTLVSTCGYAGVSHRQKLENYTGVSLLRSGAPFFVSLARSELTLINNC